MESVIANSNFVNVAANTLDIPCIVTEQYPKVFGGTVDDIVLFPSTKLFAKKQFSMVTDEVKAELERSCRKQVIMCGIESHVCVQQTTLDLLEGGYDVHLVCDALSSQRAYDRKIALKRMRDAGATLTTAEALLFDLLRGADHPKFKQISALIKQHNENHDSDPNNPF